MTSVNNSPLTEDEINQGLEAAADHLLIAEDELAGFDAEHEKPTEADRAARQRLVDRKKIAEAQQAFLAELKRRTAELSDQRTPIERLKDDKELLINPPKERIMRRFIERGSGAGGKETIIRIKK